MMPNFSQQVNSIPVSGIRDFFDLVLNTKGVISLGVGEPDFDTPWLIRKAAIDSIEKGLTSYTSNNGLLELRQEISTYLKTRFNCHYDSEEVLITTGVSEGLDITLRSILDPGDEVIIPEPCFVSYQPLVSLAYGKVVSIDTSDDDFVISSDKIRSAITPKTKAILLCSPNNPTGRMIPKETLLEIIEIAKKHNIWILSDEIYGELNFQGHYDSIASLDPSIKDQCVIMNGFSKAFAMTGWRLAFLCGPKEFIERANKIHQYCMMCSPTTSQFAAIAALQNPTVIEPMRQEYENRRNIIVNRLNEIGLKTILPEGAFYCFADIQSTGLTSTEFATQLIQSQKVAVVPGSAFGLGGEGYIRCCFAATESLIIEALNRIEQFVQSIQSS